MHGQCISGQAFCDVSKNSDVQAATRINDWVVLIHFITIDEAKKKKITKRSEFELERNEFSQFYCLS